MIDHNLNDAGLSAAEDAFSLYPDNPQLGLIAAIESYQTVTGPVMAPFGLLVTKPMVEEAWEAFVVPSQSDDAPPQSGEMRVLMGVLRWAYETAPEKA